jgi:hypothetical protein
LEEQRPLRSPITENIPTMEDIVARLKELRASIWKKEKSDNAKDRESNENEEKNKKITEEKSVTT